MNEPHLINVQYGPAIKSTFAKLDVSGTVGYAVHEPGVFTWGTTFPFTLTQATLTAVLCFLGRPVVSGTCDLRK